MCYLCLYFYIFYFCFIILKFLLHLNLIDFICNFILILLNYCKDLFNYIIRYITGRWTIDIGAF